MMMLRMKETQQCSSGVPSEWQLVIIGGPYGAGNQTKDGCMLIIVLFLNPQEMCRFDLFSFIAIPGYYQGSFLALLLGISSCRALEITDSARDQIGSAVWKAIYLPT